MKGTRRIGCLPAELLAGIVCARTTRGDAVTGHSPEVPAWESDGPEEVEVAIASVSFLLPEQMKQLTEKSLQNC